MAHVMTAGPDAYQRAADLLRGGGLVALPTETVYGLAANAADETAIERIYKVKGRPSHNPLITHILSPDRAMQYVNVETLAQTLMDEFWPGPLTLVLPRKNTEHLGRASAGLPTIAIRCPNTAWRDSIAAAGFDGALVMPSANLSGRVSPTCAAHVAEDLGDKVDLIIDGGACTAGIESTILKIENDHAVLLRPGTLTMEDFAPYISDLRLPQKGAVISAPGMLSSHYAPNARVRLNATDKREGETYLAFGPTDIDADMNLSPNSDLAEAARSLFAALRILDTEQTIAVAPIPNHGIGAGINDRLKRAAAKR